MLSFDTNLLLYSLNRDCAEYDKARAFLSSVSAEKGGVVICELVLLELYVLLRNPAVLKHPLGAQQAVATVQSFRRNPSWRLVDYPGVRTISDEIWRFAGQANVGRRVVFDARLALTLRSYGVVEFATRNIDHFQGFGFARVWNPL
jgi:uncharacterized protein